MSDEHFLSRWSRKKREAEQADKPAPTDTARDQPGAAAPEHESAAAAAPPTASEKNETQEQAAPPFDLASLPPIESIGADTDIRAFLQAGVPAELTRAALRRVWTSDPTIRDFIGIAENQWDFASPEGVPGFGPLKAIDDVRRMVAEISNELAPAAEQGAKSTPAEPAETPLESRVSDAQPSSEVEADRQAIAASSEDVASQKAEPEAAGSSIVQRNEVDVAMQQKESEEEYKPLPTRRPHGRALPE